jgi:hypothetical protein
LPTQVIEQVRLEEKDERPDMEQLARATIGKFFNRQAACQPIPFVNAAPKGRGGWLKAWIQGVGL